MKERGFDIGIRAGFALTLASGDMESKEAFFVGIRGPEIAAVEKFRPRHKKLSKKFIDAPGCVVLPGYVNGHTHLSMTLFRGLEDDVPFHVWLFKRVLPMEAKMLTKDFVRVGADLAMLETIGFGVTTVSDMYMYAEQVAESADKAGIRALITQTFASFPLPEDKDIGTDKGAVFRKIAAKYKNHPRLKIGLGPHAPYSCSDDLLREVKKIADESQCFVHIHLSETKKEVEDSERDHKMSPVERLHALGLLRKGTFCAHCVHLSEKDRELFRKSGASVIYNPDSNAKLGSGIAPIADYLRRGIPVAFGTDGSASNNNLSITGAMNLGTKLQKLAGSDNTAMTARQALYAATLGGAAALGIDSLTGSLEVGKRADLQIVNLEKPHMQPLHDIPSQLVYSACGTEAETVICDGRILMEDRRIKALNYKKVIAKAEVYRKKIQKHLAEMRKE